MYLNVTLLVLALTNSAECSQADYAPDRYFWTESITLKSLPYTVRLSGETFDPKKHKIVKNVDGSYKIDGANAYGFWRSLPRFELTKIEFWRSGVQIKVSSSLWKDLFEPNIQRIYPGDPPFVRVAATANGLRVEMEGGDGAAAYTVIFQLRADGKHSRTFVKQ